jgi:hypothetical protein
MGSPSPLPAGLTGRPFSVDEATSAGVSRSRLRASDLEAPFHGIRWSVGTSDDLRARCRAYVSRFADRRPFCAVTAARLWGLPLPRRLEDDARLHVMTLETSRAPRGAGVVGHKTSRPVELRRVDGMLVTAPVPTWISLADLLDLDDLIIAGDRLLAWRQPLVEYDELAAVVEGLSGGRGVRAARRAFSGSCRGRARRGRADAASLWCAQDCRNLN